MNGKLVIAAAVIAVASVAAAPTAWSHDLPATRWVATWSSAPIPPGSAFTAPRSFEDQTIRHIIHVSVGGRRVRVRLSNAFGAAPLFIGSVHVALHGGGAMIVPDSDRVVTFSGQSSITIPTGAVALSDPIGLDVPTRGDLAVSIYVPHDTGPATLHEDAPQTSYIAGPGDFTGATDLPGAETTTSRFWLSVVEVSTRDDVRAIVALGDSITAGGGVTRDANRTWPDLLSARLNSPSAPPRTAVLNQGIGCNRLLFDFCGQNGAARFDRDVLAVSGATHVILALGLNDIGIPVILNIPAELLTANEIIVGLTQLIERSHEKGLAIYGATITPVGSSIFPGFFTPENEAKRQAVNQWIRTSRAFDGVIDFDRVVRDPSQPTRLLPAYNSGDGVHPNDAGNLAMANAIDLWLFR